jgi:hypothetical protein
MLIHSTTCYDTLRYDEAITPLYHMTRCIINAFITAWVCVSKQIAVLRHHAAALIGRHSYCSSKDHAMIQCVNGG